MPDYPQHIKVADLTVTGSRPDALTLRSIIHDIPGKNGHVFALCELPHRDEQAREHLVHLIASHLEHLKHELSGEGNVVRRFEGMLARLNDDLVRVAQEYGVTLKKMKAVVGVVTDEQVFVTGRGDFHVLFLHRTAERRYVVYELDEQFAVTETETDPKPFLTVLDGELHAGDVLYVASRLRTTTISFGELQDILITLPPQSALQRVRQFVPVENRYGGICFHVSEEERLGPPKKMNPTNSVLQLNETTERTADILGEQGSELGEGFRSLLEKARDRLGAPGTSGAAAIVRRGLQVALALSIKGLTFLKVVFAKLFVVLRNVLVSRRKAGDRGADVGGGVISEPNSLVTRVEQGWQRLQRLNKKQKLLVGIVAALVLALILSIIFMSGNRKNAQAEEAFQTVVERIDDKRLSAEAALIYNNTADARVLLNEATALLATLPADSDNHRNDITRLQNELNAVLVKARGMTAVTPTTVATVLQGPVVTSAKSSSGLYVIGGNGHVERLRDDNTFEDIGVTTSGVSTLRASTAADGDVLLLDDTLNLARFSPTAKTITAVASGVSGLASANALTYYNSTAYILASASEQIVKMRPQGDGFEAGTPWITARTTSLTSARAVAIDGDIYVLTATDIVKFRSGREETWAHDAFDPVLNNPVALGTDTTSSFLYILDAGDGRVIVVNKETGKVIRQYTSEMLVGALNLHVDEGKKVIMVVTANALLQFSYDH